MWNCERKTHQSRRIQKDGERSEKAVSGTCCGRERFRAPNAAIDVEGATVLLRLQASKLKEVAKVD